MKKQGLSLRFLSAQQWAISPDVLAVMGGIAARDLDNLDLSSLGLNTEMVAAKVGKKNAAGVEMRDGIAIIPVTGVISKYSSMLENICGGTSHASLAKYVTAAVEDPACTGIILKFDSVGGQASGTNAVAELIYTARGKKPIKAFVDGNAASAAYWIASACDEIIIDALGFVGSIGTVQTFQFAKKDEEAETLELVSSQSPYKRLDPRTKEGKAKYQASLDAMSDVFIGAVAKHRGITPDKVMSDYAQGWSLMGSEAVAAGMADRLGSFEGVFKEMTKGRQGMKTGTFAAMSFSEGMATADVVAALTELRPDVATAMATGITFEGIPSAEAMATDELVAMLSEARPDVVETLQAAGVPVDVMAIDKAADVVKAAGAAGVPELSATLLAEGVTFEQASAQIAMAGGLKDVLAAAGLSGSLSALLEHGSDPVKMVSTAIHEAKAAAAEGDGQEAETPAKPKASLNARDIYAARAAQ